MAAADPLSPDTISVRQALDRARALLTAQDNPRLEAEMLLASVLAVPRERFYADPDRPLAPDRAADFQTLVRRRCRGYPMAYLTGEREFWSLPFRVSRDTLIPRPETEHLVEAALERLPARACLSVLDLGTGSGAIAVALAAERPHCRITATDISRAALAVARDNAARAGAGHIRFLESDWFSSLARERFHLIVSNPPYVESGYTGFISGEIRHEPHLALDGGPSGLSALRHIIAAAPARLYAGGSLLLEHADHQADAVRQLLTRHHYHGVQTLPDLSGRARLTLAGAP